MTGKQKSVHANLVSGRIYVFTKVLPSEGWRSWPLWSDCTEAGRQGNDRVSGFSLSDKKTLQNVKKYSIY